MQKRKPDLEAISNGMQLLDSPSRMKLPFVLMHPGTKLFPRLVWPHHGRQEGNATQYWHLACGKLLPKHLKQPPHQVFFVCIYSIVA